MNSVKQKDIILEKNADYEIFGNDKKTTINPVTLAAMQEAEAMINGEKPCTWYHSPEDFINALKKEIEN